jgi:hypothetical protein
LKSNIPKNRYNPPAARATTPIGARAKNVDPGLKGLDRQGYNTITSGHDTPVQRSAIDSTITYIKRAKEIHVASADATTYSESLKAAFPGVRDRPSDCANISAANMAGGLLRPDN